MTPFFHWFPKAVRVALVRRFWLGTFEKASSISKAVFFVERARLLTFEMFEYLFKDAQIFKERFFGLTKSFVAIKK